MYSDYEIAKFYVHKCESCAERGVDFDVTLSHFIQLFNNPTCYYSGMDLAPYVEGSKNPFRVTIDRVDNKQGYTDDNIVLCSWIANNIKARLEDDVVKLLSRESFHKMAELFEEAMYDE